MAKLIFYDVDGTLFRFDCRVSPSTDAAIRKTVADGNLAFLCTGRGASTMPAEVRELPLSGEICGCGTYVRIGENVIVNAAIEGEDCQKIIEILKKYKCPFFVENPDFFYYDPQYLPAGFDKIIEGMKGRYPGCFKEVSKLPNRISKMTGYPEDKAAIPAIRQALSSWFNVISHDEYDYIELTLKDHTKGTGILKIMEALGVKKEDTYGFGDSANDIPMLETVGHGIVMGDAPSELKERFISTDSIYNDGIAKAMAKFDLI